MSVTVDASLNSKECCPMCNRPNEEYVKLVARSKGTSHDIKWFTTADGSKFVILYGTGNSRSEEVFTEWNDAASRYDELVHSS